MYVKVVTQTLYYTEPSLLGVLGSQMFVNSDCLRTWLGNMDVPIYLHVAKQCENLAEYKLTFLKMCFEVGRLWTNYVVKIWI
jgi:hypothetical protein